MNILVGCEESQVVTMAFRGRGYEAYSCDLMDPSGGYPDYHIKADIVSVMINGNWDMIILHPPCTYTAVCGNRWYSNSPLRDGGASFCLEVWRVANRVCSKVALEQPKTIMQKYLGPKTQVIHPWQFGEGEVKETWLWLKGLPCLEPTNIVEGREPRIWKMGKTKDPGVRRRLRSVTYPGIANAMADQWGSLL